MDQQEPSQILIQDLTNKCALDITHIVMRNMYIMNVELDPTTVSSIAAAAMIKALVTFAEASKWRKGLLHEAIDIYMRDDDIKLQL